MSTGTSRSRTHFHPPWIVLVSILLFFLVVGPGPGPGTMITTVDASREFRMGNGTLINGVPFYGFLLRDQPFYGIGLNYFDGFTRYLANSNDLSWQTGLQTLHNYSVPYIRINFFGFWASDLTVNYGVNQAAKDLFYAKFTTFLNYASSQNVGVIPSLFFSFSEFARMCGEPISAWGIKRSCTRETMRNWTTEIVTRFYNHSALWAWEFNNEANMHTDIVMNYGWGGSTYFPIDSTIPASVNGPIKEYVNIIRSIDPNVPIFSGNGLPYFSSYHLNYDNTWDKDSREELAVQIARDCTNTGTLYIHLYPDEVIGRLFNGTQPTTDTMIDLLMQRSYQTHQPVLIGEWGSTLQQSNSSWTDLVTSIQNHRVPMASVWVFDFTWHDSTINIKLGGPLAWRLDVIKQMNFNRTTWQPNGLGQ